MVRVLLTIWALAFLGGLVTGKSVFAQTVEPEWAAKPIQCGPTYDVFLQMQDSGMKTFFGSSFFKPFNQRSGMNSSGS